MPESPDYSGEKPITEMVASFGDRMRSKHSILADKNNEKDASSFAGDGTKQNMSKETCDRNREQIVLNKPNTFRSVNARPPYYPHPGSASRAVDVSKLVPAKRTTTTHTKTEQNKRDSKRVLGEGSIVTALNRLSGLIEACIVAEPAKIEEAHDALREHLHVLEHRQLTVHSIRQSTALGSNSLKRCFSSEEHDFPADLKDDAEVLFKKWALGDVNVDLMRGIKYDTKGGARFKLEGDTFQKTHAFYGNGAYLVNGKWWPLQIAALYDGAHGAMQAGISGDIKQGAYSVLVSGSEYEDIDHGDEVGYTGTKSTNDVPTVHTLCMKASLRTMKPVRLLRTSKLPLDNIYRPEKGIRYDGLYQVVDEECLQARTHHWRFLLRRMPGQDAIRYKGKGKRPTKQDLMAWDACQQLKGFFA